jgi:hypothetical protein
LYWRWNSDILLSEIYWEIPAQKEGEIVNKYEGLLRFHARPLLGLGERIEGIGYLTSGLIFVQHYIAGVTDRRLIMVQVGPGLFGLNAIYEDLLDFPFKSIESLEVRRFLILKNISMRLVSEEQYRFRVNALSRVVPRQRDFYDKLKEKYEHFRSKG